ncbi:hypothetical protein KKH07_02155 [Patescibacteria group bacterium]|nr:hypothetical protein [Patescibacteria group bacterium]MBU1563650.1 hypothetical protein [Patescibacteria group bacterium]MBU2068070.1 hypothetical protein [Patescibacteria group bacterium]
MLSYFKETVKKNESDILLTITIVLVALISFGAGLFIDFSEDNQSIVIQQPTASIQQSLAGTCESSSAKATADKEGIFVGSVNSNKYHWPDCPSAKKIAEQNQIWFNSEQEAQNANYIRCSNFEKYTP